MHYFHLPAIIKIWSSPEGRTSLCNLLKLPYWKLQWISSLLPTATSWQLFHHLYVQPPDFFHAHPTWLATLCPALKLFFQISSYSPLSILKSLGPSFLSSFVSNVHMSMSKISGLTGLWLLLSPSILTWDSLASQDPWVEFKGSVNLDREKSVFLFSLSTNWNLAFPSVINVGNTPQND